jgi:hypothetical protein
LKESVLTTSSIAVTLRAMELVVLGMVASLLATSAADRHGAEFSVQMSRGWAISRTSGTASVGERGQGHAVSTMQLDATSLTITVPIEVVGGTDEMLTLWKDAIDAAWNRGNDGRPFTVCERDVRFNPRFQRRPADGQVPRNVHVVVIEDVAPGDRYVSRVWHALGTSPAYSSRTGFWGSNTDPATAAHEFGHLLGLLDEYEENDTNANGLREPGETPLPNERRFPDAWLSLMAQEHGSVLYRHVREVVRMHTSPSTALCGPQ